MQLPRKVFLLTNFMFAVLMLTILIIYLSDTIDAASFISILIGAAMAYLNYLAGMGIAVYGIHKSNAVFLISLWGGMLFRMLVMLSLVVICLKFLDLSTDNFIFSVLFFYVFFLISEIIYLNLRKS